CTQTLPPVQAQFDLRLVEPASMLGSVMDLQPIPKIAALLFAVVADQRLAAVDIEVIHDEVDLPGEGVLLDDVPPRRANSAAQRSGVAVVKCRPDFGSTTANTFAVPQRSGASARPPRTRREQAVGELQSINAP